jgi:hypothetical protein
MTDTANDRLIDNEGKCSYKTTKHSPELSARCIQDLQAATGLIVDQVMAGQGLKQMTSRLEHMFGPEEEELEGMWITPAWTTYAEEKQSETSEQAFEGDKAKLLASGASDDVIQHAYRK